MWTQCMVTLLQAGCQQFMECGPGKVLTGLVKRIDRSVTCTPLEEPENLNLALTETAA